MTSEYYRVKMYYAVKNNDLPAVLKFKALKERAEINEHVKQG